MQSNTPLYCGPLPPFTCNCSRVLATSMGFVKIAAKAGPAPLTAMVSSTPPMPARSMTCAGVIGGSTSSLSGLATAAWCTSFSISGQCDDARTWCGASESHASSSVTLTTMPAASLDRQLVLVGDDVEFFAACSPLTASAERAAGRTRRIADATAACMC